MIFFCRSVTNFYHKRVSYPDILFIKLGFTSLTSLSYDSVQLILLGNSSSNFFPASTLFRNKITLTVWHLSVSYIHIAISNNQHLPFPWITSKGPPIFDIYIPLSKSYISGDFPSCKYSYLYQATKEHSMLTRWDEKEKLNSYFHSISL